MVRKHLSLKQGLKLKKSLKISFWRYHDHGAVLKFVDYSVRGTMLLVRMDIHIAVACTDGRNRPKNITNWRVWTCDGPGIIYILPEVAVARSYLTFCLTDRWTARANLKILLKLCFAFLLSCWENGPGLLYFLERALTMTSYLFLFEKEWRVVDARL